ncbi:MAG: hypothetical protein IJV27_05960 [Prevotella sp.]|nr:hypothetical protein [Prevotella sp.]
MFSALSISAQTAKQILDKTASIVGRTGGASGNFRMTSPTYGSTSGIIAIKGKKFYANTAEAKVWFDGKTQWAYLKSTDEVSISTPTQAEQMAMNPYTFINIYKTGFKMNMKTISGNYEIHLIAQNKKRTIQEMYITIGKDYLPKSVKMRQGTSWTNIFISKFLAKDQNDSIFKFNSKDCPNAEIIDLR